MDVFSKIKRLLVKKKTEVGDCSEVVFNYEIIQRVFCYLDLKSLKNCRLVCKLWSYEAGKLFNNLVIRLYPKLKKKNLEQLSSFLTQHRLQHMLVLSLLKPCCLMNQDEYACWLDLEELMTGPIVRSYYNQKNKTEFFTSISKYLTITTPYLTELRLEINLMTEEDAKLFGIFLTGLTALRRLSLDIVSVEEKAVAFIPKNCVPSSLQTLGFRVHPNIVGRRPLPQSSYTLFMKLFSNIRFLDLDTWRMWVFIILGQPDTMERFIQVMSTMCDEDENAFPNLTGLKLCISTPEEWRILLTFPISLTHISIHSYQHKLEKSYVKTFQKLLFRHSKTLTTLNVFLFPKKEKIIPTLRQVRLPCLPYLKTLVITSSGNLNKNTAHWELDIFNLRSLFRDNKLHKVLPSLNTLCILLPWEEGQGIWEYIIPDKTLQNVPVVANQIEYLTLSMNNEDCSYAPRIDRLMRIFPKLKILRHTKISLCKHHKGVIGCEHRITSPTSWTYGPIGKVVKKDKEHPSAIYFGHQMHHQFLKGMHSLEDPFFWHYVALKF